MPVTDEMCIEASNKSDYALVVIGCTAGESSDNFAGAESYLLTETEEDLLRIVSKHFKKVCVALNTGNIIDMKRVEKYNIPCVLYCWQGGMLGCLKVCLLHTTRRFFRELQIQAYPEIRAEICLQDLTGML